MCPTRAAKVGRICCINIFCRKSGFISISCYTSPKFLTSTAKGPAIIHYHKTYHFITSDACIILIMCSSSGGYWEDLNGEISSIKLAGNIWESSILFLKVSDLHGMQFRTCYPYWFTEFSSSDACARIFCTFSNILP